MSVFQKKEFWSGAIFFGFVLGLVWVYSWHAHLVTEKDSSECRLTYDLLDSKLDCDQVLEKSGKIFDLEMQVSQYIQDETAVGHISRTSVFFRDLNSRRWFGVNADDVYYPASLAKLPLAIAYYKISEITPNIWDQTLTLSESKQFTNNGQSFGTDSPLQLGQSYSTKDMVENMLEYSDNRIIYPLSRAIDQSIWEKTAEDIGIRKQTSDNKEEWIVSPRIIAATLRSLYNASYLSPLSSNALLHSMTEAKFTGGLVAGVPPSIRVAHKFGEAVIQESDGKTTPTLHDCGIIYKTEKPYILCVMTEGKDFHNLEQVIAGISKRIYEAN